MELEVPPALGNGQANAGLPLARLLWHLPARAMVSLVEALLLERRILMVAQDKDTVSAAVHGAAALLYPFSWQHIYLPLLPLALKVSCSIDTPSYDLPEASHFQRCLSQIPLRRHQGDILRGAATRECHRRGRSGKECAILSAMREPYRASVPPCGACKR